MNNVLSRCVICCNRNIINDRDTKQGFDIWIVWLRFKRIPEKITISILPSAILAPICKSPPSGPERYGLTIKPVSFLICIAVVPVPHKSYLAKTSLFSLQNWTMSAFCDREQSMR